MRHDMQTVLHLVPDRYSYNNTSSFSCYRLDALSNTPPTVSKHWRQYDTYNNTHTHTCLMALCLGLPGWDGTRKVKPIWILLKQETVSGNGISWAICKSAPRSRQTTTPAPHCSVFTGRMPFLPPNQQHQSTEGKHTVNKQQIKVTSLMISEIKSGCSKMYKYEKYQNARAQTSSSAGLVVNWLPMRATIRPLTSRSTISMASDMWYSSDMLIPWWYL